MSGPNGSLIISLPSCRNQPVSPIRRRRPIDQSLSSSLNAPHLRFSLFTLRAVQPDDIRRPSARADVSHWLCPSLARLPELQIGEALTLSRKFDCPEEEWEDTLIHEMIHLHIAANGIVDTSTHGKVFRQMMHDINARWGRHITISKRLSGEEAERETLSAPRFFCVVKLPDGRTALTVAAKTCINRLWRDIPRLFHTVSIDWYWSADAYFSRFPVARTARLYVVKPDELAPHLAKAVRLTQDGKRID